MRETACICRWCFLWVEDVGDDAGVGEDRVESYERVVGGVGDEASRGDEVGDGFGDQQI